MGDPSRILLPRPWPLKDYRYYLLKGAILLFIRPKFEGNRLIIKLAFNKQRSWTIMIVSVLSCLSSRQPRSHKFLPLTVLCNDAQSYFVLGMPTRRAATPGNWTIPPAHLAQLCWHINEYKKIIVWVSSINKLVPQKRNAEISESDDAFHLPEEVDNATGMDLPWQQCSRRRVEGRGTIRGQKSCPSPQEKSCPWRRRCL